MINWSVTLTLRWTRTRKGPGRPEGPKGAKAWSWNRRRMVIWRKFTINVNIDFYGNMVKYGSSGHLHGLSGTVTAPCGLVLASRI